MWNSYHRLGTVVGVQVLGAYTPITETELIWKDAIRAWSRVALPVGGAGVLGEDRSVWTTAIGKGFVKEGELALSMMTKIGL